MTETRRKRHPAPRLSGRGAGNRKSTHHGPSTGLGSFCADLNGRIVEAAISFTLYAAIYTALLRAIRKGHR